MEKPLIMIVEDEVDFANATARLIASTEKYDAVTAYSAKEAFDLLKKNKIRFGPRPNRIQLILLDIKMPEMDGLQFLEKLRKSYEEEKIGVILITAYEDEEKWERAASGFVAGYITKPFEENALLSGLEKFFSSDKAKLGMVLDTFEKHIEKEREFKEKPETSK